MENSYHDKFKRIFETDEKIAAMMNEFENLKIEMKNEIMNYCRRADPLDVSSRTGVPTEEVIECLEVLQKNKELKDLMLMAIHIDKPFEEEIERILFKAIKESYYSSY